MDYAPAERAPVPAATRDGLLPLKILIAGGFGVGKTTLVRS
jgi:GTPase SAR1 family protein